MTMAAPEPKHVIMPTDVTPRLSWSDRFATAAPSDWRQNTQSRANASVQHKLNAIADGLSDLMAKIAHADSDDVLHKDMRELRAAVGLEDKESA